MIASNPADRATPPALVLRTVTTPSLADVQRLIAGAEEDMGMSGWPSASTLGALHELRHFGALSWVP